MSRKVDTSDSQRRLLFSDKLDGYLPKESELVEKIYDSDRTDLEVFDYTHKGLATSRKSGHYTFFFRDQEEVVKISIESSIDFDEVNEKLENGPRELANDDHIGAVARRIGEAMLRFDYEEFNLEEYREDFKEMYEEEVIELENK